MINNEIADEKPIVPKTSPQNNSVTNDEQSIGLFREIHRERNISPDERQKIIDDLRLI